MTEASFREWMDAYGVAFVRQDADAAAGLFTNDGTYEWGPFGELLRADFAVKLEDALCREFREWWNVKEEAL